MSKLVSTYIDGPLSIAFKLIYSRGLAGRSMVLLVLMFGLIAAPSGLSSKTALSSNAQVFAPLIDSICPSSPQATIGNQTVEVRGVHFESGLTVTVFFPGGGSGTLSGAQIGGFSSTQFLMLIDFNGNPGSYSIRVNNPSGSLSPLFTFQVSQTAQKPRIFSISPASPLGTSGFQTITVNGDNLRNNSTVAVSRQGVPVPTQSVINFGCTGLSMQVDFQGIAGSHSVTVRNPDSGLTSDPFSFNVQQVCNPPSITAQPVDQTINSGQQAGLVVSAAGTAPLSYQWYRGTSGNTSNPVGTNSASFTTPILTSTTTYWVRISNSCGTVDSRTVTVFVGAICTPPSIAAGEPIDHTVLSGQQAGLVVTANGAASLSYQWYQGISGNTSNPVGTNSPTFTTPPLTSTTTYWVRVANACGSIDSRTATVSIGICTLACTASSPGTGTVASPVSFAATATPTGCSNTPTFDWDFGDGTPHSSQQNPTHTYTVAGTYNWVMVADTVNTNLCLKTGTIIISPATQFCITSSVLPAGAGTISRSPSGPCYNSGSVVTLTANPQGSFIFDHWSGDVSGSSNPLTITINSSKTIVANFATGSSSASLSGTIGIWDGRLWPLDGANVTAKTIVLRSLNTGQEYTQAILSGADYNFDPLSSGSYDLTATINYIDNASASSQAQCGPSLVGCEGAQLAKTTTVRKIVRISGRARFDIELPLPLVMVHGVRSCYDRWATWDNYATSSGFLSLTPNYHWRVDQFSEWRFVANQVKLQIENNLKGLTTRAKNNSFPEWIYIGHSQGGLVARALVNEFPHTASVRSLRKIFILGTPNSGALREWLDALGCVNYLDEGAIKGEFNVTYPDYSSKEVFAYAGFLIGTTNDTVVSIDSVHLIVQDPCFFCSPRVTQEIPFKIVPFVHSELGMSASIELLDNNTPSNPRDKGILQQVRLLVR